jgi:hypothetical protein
LEGFLLALADGSLEHDQVFRDQGHGALVYETKPLPMDGEESNLVVTGPKRNLIRPSSTRHSLLRPYFATPFGDMMMAGCYGLLAATAELLPELAESIHSAMSNTPGAGVSPWNIL